MAFVYYEDGQYSVYSVDNPRSLRREPYQGPSSRPVTLLMAEANDPLGPGASRPHGLGRVNGVGGPGAPVVSDGHSGEGVGSSISRSPTGFRPPAMPAPAES